MVSLKKKKQNRFKIIKILFFLEMFSVPPHSGMQMQPMPPMGYQAHQMPPNVSVFYSCLKRFIIFFH